MSEEVLAGKIDFYLDSLRIRYEKDMKACGEKTADWSSLVQDRSVKRKYAERIKALKADGIILTENQFTEDFA